MPETVQAFKKRRKKLEEKWKTRSDRFLPWQPERALCMETEGRDAGLVR